MFGENKGITLALATAFISGFAVFMNKFAITFWQNSSVFTTAKNIIVAVLLISVIILFGKIKELKSLNRNNWLKLILIGFIGGAIPFLLFFKGLSMTDSVNAAFIHKTLFIWVAILAIPFLGEKLYKIQILSLAIISLGVYLFVSPANFSLGTGELLVFGATILWAIENIIAKKILKEVSPIVTSWGRMFFGSLFLIAFIILTGNGGALLDISFAKFGWLMISGVVLFGYVTTWYSALKFAPAGVAKSILVLAFPITAILNSIFITHKIPFKIILPTVILAFGIILISPTTNRLKKYAEQKLQKRPNTV